MRQQGRLTDWNDARGFGYITPLAGGPTVFVHITAFPQDVRRPLLYDLVTYEESVDPQGRRSAQAVQHLTPTRSAASPTTPVGARPAGFWSSLFTEIYKALFSDYTLEECIRRGKRGVRVTGAGVVRRILPDDTIEPCHQRFILQVESGHTLLAAHNIDVAPRLTSVGTGDTVEFSGEYVWNAQGGVIHWTHRDPSGRRPAGWLKHRGRTVQ